MSFLSSSLAPTAVVLPYAGTSAPSGWLLCNGAAISRTTYAALFAAIGTTHGSGDGSTTFNIPDYRGRFLRGVDTGTGRDPDSATRAAMSVGGNTGDAVGSIQTHDFFSHTHSVNNSTNIVRQASGMGYQSDAGQQRALVTISVNNSGGNETRPINANVNHIIKI